MVDFSRYHRQIILPGVGEAGQRRLSESTVLIVGAGALGSAIADSLARAGVGRLRIVDRDVVEWTNLQRQVLYDESDARAGLPKAEAARRKLQAINSRITIEAVVDDFNAANARSLSDGADLIMDGLDNFQTRYLLNDLAVWSGRPYIYGGAIGTGGMSMTVLPASSHRNGSVPPGRIQWDDSQTTPCLRCMFPDPPPAGSTPTCDTAGVMHAAVSMVTAHQCAQAFKLLTGRVDRVDRSLWSVDLEANTTHRMQIDAARRDDCVCCGRGNFEYFDGQRGGRAAALCGRDAVQIIPSGSIDLDLDTLAGRLADHGEFTRTAHLVRGTLHHTSSDNGDGEAGGSPIGLTVFPNGRAMIHGVDEPDRARAIYSRYVGD